MKKLSFFHTPFFFFITYKILTCERRLYLPPVILSLCYKQKLFLPTAPTNKNTPSGSHPLPLQLRGLRGSPTRQATVLCAYHLR